MTTGQSVVTRRLYTNTDITRRDYAKAKDK